MKEYTADVLICGAGAAGLTLAIDLARRGISFWLIEKMQTPFQGSRGKGLQPRSLEVFEDLGILDKMMATGGSYPVQREHQPDGSYQDSALIETNEAAPAEPYRTPLMVPQFLTEKIMRERLAELGYRPKFGCELRDFKQDSDGVTASITSQSGEESLRVRYLIGTDGGRSFVRQALDIGFPGKTLGMRAVVADVVLHGLSRDAWHRFNDGSMENQLALCPLAGTTLFQLQAPIPLEGEADLSAEGLNQMLATRTQRDDIRIDTVHWASAFSMNARLAERYRVGRVFLAGDAAHVHPPTGGQGLNTSLQDAYNLGWKLAAVLQGAPESLLDTYEEERRPIAAGILGLSTKLLDEAKQGVMRRGREVHQLDLGYIGSPLAIEKPARNAGVLAGDRAPDAQLTSAAGQGTRLFNLFAGPHWTLLTYNVEQPLSIAPRYNLHIHQVGVQGDIIDDKCQLRNGYGIVDGDWILVRPDGYIGAITSRHNIATLEDYMKQVGLVAQ